MRTFYIFESIDGDEVSVAEYDDIGKAIAHLRTSDNLSLNVSDGSFYIPSREALEMALNEVRQQYN